MGLRAGIALVGAAGLLFAAGGSAGEGLKRLKLCNPRGGIRAERVSRGVRIRYTDGAGRPEAVDFVLRGWEARAAWSAGKGACVALGRAGEAAEETLRAKDEVYSVGGPFQDKVILRRSQRVIELGGERIVIEGTEVVHPKTEKKGE